MSSRTLESTIGPCRLCGGSTELRFTALVLGKHSVGYCECARCGSLQTETPYWLAEAYAKGNLASLNTGAAQRNLNNLGISWSLAKGLKLHDVLDVGGGDGLLCRLLRDHGINCYVRDEYASGHYASAFSEPDFGGPEMVLCFEVLEHFADPNVSLPSVFALGAEAVLATTELYRGQGQDWWYLAPETGQHVFFYSEDALRLIGQRFGYELLQGTGYLLFLRRDGHALRRRALWRLLLRSTTIKLARLATQILPPRGVAKDFYAVRERLARQQPGPRS